ncbi:MAG: hypothetical protein OWQ48_00195 [Desulfurococcus sp.]|nr:hypothetical protein [Desulfurococcus sp.]
MVSAIFFLLEATILNTVSARNDIKNINTNSIAVAICISGRDNVAKNKITKTFLSLFNRRITANNIMAIMGDTSERTVFVTKRAGNGLKRRGRITASDV